jgi:hypothetical protein
MGFTVTVLGEETEERFEGFANRKEAGEFAGPHIEMGHRFKVRRASRTKSPFGKHGRRTRVCHRRPVTNCK